MQNILTPASYEEVSQICTNVLNYAKSNFFVVNVRRSMQRYAIVCTSKQKDTKGCKND